MKNLWIYATLSLLIISISGAYGQGQFKIRNDDFIHVGYGIQKSITFGHQSAYTPDNGLYAIESFNNGLNFWKPWPNPSGYGNYVLFLRPDKNIGIGTSGSSSYRLDVNGRIRAWGWTSPSDRRLKTNISSVSLGLDKVLALNPVSYNYKFKTEKYQGIDKKSLSENKLKSMEGDNLEVDETMHIGLIAQEVKEVIPELVVEDEEGILGINYIELIPILIQSIKEQQKQINTLKAEVELLKKD